MNLLASSIRTFTHAGIYVPNQLKFIQGLSERSYNKSSSFDEELDRLRVISELHKEEGIHYDGQESFFDAIENKGADCQGMSLLYSLVMDQFPDSKIRLVGFKKDTSSDSHVALKPSTKQEIWETTKPGLIQQSEITNSGYSIVMHYPEEAMFDLPEAISLSHLHARERYQDIFRFLDSIIIHDSKYPSPEFYLKQKLKAIIYLHSMNEMTDREYFSQSKKILEDLSYLEPKNIEIIIQQVKLNLEFDKSLDLKHNIEMLESFNKDDVRNINDTRIIQEYFFVLGQCFLLSFIQTDNKYDKNHAIQNFREVLNYNTNQNLQFRAHDSLNTLRKS
jgi:hypothetical protein